MKSAKSSSHPRKAKIAAPAPAPVPRAERVSARRKQLIELTMELVREGGYGALSVNRLAERASMSVGGLYRYIKTKSDLLEMLIDGIHQNINEQMLVAASQVRGVEEKLAVVFKAYWDLCWDSAEPVLVAYREWQSLPAEAQRRYIEQESQVTEYFGDLIRAGVASGEFRHVDSRMLASEMVFLAQMRAVKGWAFRDWPREKVFAEHWELIHGRFRGGPEAK